ncbi:MAG: 50S ribosomal protein L23 [Microthrixaceae bacterium]
MSANQLGKDPRSVILRPVVSEKSYGLLDQGVYTFEVASDSSKPEIRDAVQAIWPGVKVQSVNTLNRKGKRMRNRRSPTFGRRSNIKRALVTLSPDSAQIDLFEVK